MELQRPSARVSEALAAGLCPDADSENTIASKISESLDAVSPAQIYPASVTLHRQGAVAAEVFFIESGLVKLVRSEEGGRELIADLRFAGYLLGDAAVISNRPHPLTAITLIETSVRRITAKVFCRLLQTDERFAWGVRQAQSREAFDNLARITQLGCVPARHRLEHLLRLLIMARAARTLAGDVRLELPLKNWEVAQLIAVTPTYLSRLFAQLEKAGILKRSAGWIIVRDPRKLWHWSE
jgi:CRP-like cAMP-binding protein